MDNSDLAGLTINEVAELLRVHRRTVENWMNRGVGGVKLQAKKCGRQWFITREAIEAFQEACTPKPIDVQPSYRTVYRRRPETEAAMRRHKLI